MANVRGVPHLSLLCSFKFSCTNELPTASTSSVAAVTPNCSNSERRVRRGEYVRNRARASGG